MKKLATLIISISFVVYPFLVYWGLNRFSPRGLAAVLLALVMVRAAHAAGRRGYVLLLLAMSVVVFAPVLIFNDGQYLLYVPFIINMSLLFVFGSTILKPPALIERFARLEMPDLPPSAVAYCRNVTKVWCAFFVINGGIALGSAVSGAMPFWTLYNGFVSYTLIGLLFAAEFCYRKIVKVPTFDAELARMAGTGTGS